MNNIWGFDLNPLAVIASRTNYLLALGELAYELEKFELPIYLADSVVLSSKTENNMFGEVINISTSVKEFHLPAFWAKSSQLYLSRAIPLIEKMINLRYTVQEAMKLFKKEGLAFPPHEQIVQMFYDEILELERQGKNGIWARFLKNASAPVMAGSFDFVIGNPPWIRWDYLSKEYQKATNYQKRRSKSISCSLYSLVQESRSQQDSNRCIVA